MTSTLSCEPLFLTCTIFLLILCFGCTLATIKALTRLHAYITRRFGKPFRFLDLPPEIRTMAYRHHFVLYRTSEYLKQYSEMEMLPDAILGVNRQIYEEASHALYSPYSLWIYISTDTRDLERYLRREQQVLRYTAMIQLQICWPQRGWYASSTTGDRHGPAVMELEANIKTVCALLTRTPNLMPHNLRTVRIEFVAERGSRPLKHRIPGLLRPLKQLRRARPGIVVKMPHGCPVSTAELAEQQQECPFESEREHVEDLEELQGDLSMMEGELRRLTGR